MLASFQLALFDGPAVAVDLRFTTLRRAWLDDAAWIDHAPGWVSGSDRLFLEVLRAHRWGQRTRWMYDRRVREPRLTAWWELGSGTPLVPAIVEEMRLRLSDRYGELFDSVGFNLYRDGQDSVAWHGDKIDAGLVTGGATQRTWDHSVPKIARAGPRISLAFRHGIDKRAYVWKRTVEPDR
jgi:alkylated DNA repair dioxygenase AlkB